MKWVEWLNTDVYFKYVTKLQLKSQRSQQIFQDTQRRLIMQSSLCSQWFSAVVDAQVWTRLHLYCSSWRKSGVLVMVQPTVMSEKAQCHPEMANATPATYWSCSSYTECVPSNIKKRSHSFAATKRLQTLGETSLIPEVSRVLFMSGAKGV